MVRPRRSLLHAPLVAASVFVVSSSALAETRTVGKGKQHPNLAAVVSIVNPGDIVEVYDDEAYPTAADGPRFTRSGEPNAKITIRGIRNAQGKRPTISGGNGWTLFFNANHYLFEALEVTGGVQSCILDKGNDLTIRDAAIHDCPRHGLLGLDEGSGSLTMEYVEVYKCGLEKAGEALKHPVYVSSDASPTTGFPGSVFRMEHCWVHDAVDGNNVKSRAERNEIRYNWIEGAGYYELELIGPDQPNFALAREDSEVVGNVFIKTNNKSDVVRIGGDGTADTNGRYRFLNNTFIVTSNVQGLIRGNDGVESLEFSNNVAYKLGGGSINAIFRSAEVRWAQGSPRISGANNWFPEGSGEIPKEYTGTILGKDPGFVSTNPLDVRLSPKSVLIDKGTDSSPPAPNAPFPKPLAAPERVPSQRALPPLDRPIARPKTGTLDIGAYELGSEAPPGAPGIETTPQGSDDDGDAGTGKKRDLDACGCGVVGSSATRDAGLLVTGIAFVAYALRRRRQGS